MFYREFITLNLLFVSALFYINISYFTPRTDFHDLIGSVTFLFVLLGLIYYRAVKLKDGFKNLNVYLGAGIMLRFALLFFLPNLSDDFYRFLWDGNLASMGFDPYRFTPNQFTTGHELSEYAQGLLTNMNSPDYHTVYTPLNQYLFQAVASVFPEQLLPQVIFMKASIFTIECVTIFILPKLLRLLQINPLMSLLYVLNPLVIVEGVGNLHFEVVSVMLFCLFLWLYLQDKIRLSFVVLALCIHLKLIQLILLPALMLWMGLRKGILFISILLASTLILFLPYWPIELSSEGLSGFALYFNKFEFNASIYYLVRHVGYHLVGYNIIKSAGTFLALSSTLLILVFAIFRHKNLKRVLQALYLSMVVYYLFSTTVHPWYVVNVLILGILSGMHWSAAIWTFTVFLSYYPYAQTPIQESVTLLWIEYGLFILVLMVELLKKDIPKGLFFGKTVQRF